MVHLTFLTEHVNVLISEQLRPNCLLSIRHIVYYITILAYLWIKVKKIPQEYLAARREVVIMSKSISAKFTSEVLELFSAYMEKNSERLIEESLHKGEKPSSPPVVPKTRIVDTEDGRVFYANEDGRSGITVFYLHGGAYYMDFARAHWIFMNKLIKEADVQLIAPAYRRLPFATWRDAFDFVVPLYREYCDSHPEQKIVLMGDSAGGGLSVSLTEQFKAEGIRLPDELILMSPWVDISMDNEQIKDYIPRDPFLPISQLHICAEYWRGDLDVHDWHVSPIYGDVKGIRNVTVFVGTDEIFYPDVTKFFSMLDDDPFSELIVGEEMNHVHPIFPIAEAVPAVQKIIQIVKRQPPF